MINMTDVSAVDKLIDFYGDNCNVSFEDQTFELYDFRDHCVDNKISLGIDNFIVNSKGIFNDNACIVRIVNNDDEIKSSRDSLNRL
jgi:hypothetical protein